MPTSLRELIQSCVQGTRTAQNRLYDQFSSGMYTLCLRYCSSREEAEDLLQEGFMKVFDSLHQYRFEGSFEGWMKRVFINQALQRLRRKSRLHALLPLEDQLTEMPATAESYTWLEAKELLELIQSLPSSYRLVFNLYVFEGYPHKEIASMLGIAEGTSKSNLYDARKWLQQRIEVADRSHHVKLNANGG